MINRAYDVVLIKLPFTGKLNAPSLSLAILKALNEKNNIKTHVIESEVEFAESIGMDLYHDLVWPNTEVLFFDALFSTIIFDDQKIDSHFFRDYFKTHSLSEAQIGIIQKHSFLKGCENLGEFLAILFDYLQPRCEKFIEKMAIQICHLNPIIVGSTTTFEQTLSSIALFKKIKSINSSILNVLGGFNCELYAGKVLKKNFSDVDIVFSGEAEIEFPYLCSEIKTSDLNSYLQKKKDVTWNKLNAYLANDDVPAIRLSVENMEHSPTPDFRDFFFQICVEKKIPYKKVVLPFISSKGCWWGEKNQCSFCGLNEETLKYKSKKPEVLFNELVELHKEYGISNFLAVDLILPAHYYSTVVEKLSHLDPKFSIYYQLKSNVNLNQVEALKMAGIDHVQPGIESFDDEELREMNKGVTGIQNIAFLKYSKMNDIKVTWNILYNTHTTKNSKLEDLEFLLPMLAHLYPPKGIRPMNYPRDSVLYKDREKNGLDLRPNPLYKHIYRFNDEDILDFAYFYCDFTEATNVIDLELLEKIKKIHANWSNNYFKQTPELTFKVEKDFIHVVDSRFGEPKKYYLTLEILPILQLAIEPISINKLLDAFKDGPVEEILNDLIEKKLFYKSDKKVLNLMIPL